MGSKRFSNGFRQQTEGSFLCLRSFSKESREVLGEGRTADALFGDDAGNETVVGDVKGGIIALHLGQCHGLGVKLGLDLLWVPLFNADVRAGGAVHINGGGGTQHIKGNPIILGQNGNPAGADLVGRVAVGRHTVTPHETGVDPPVFHDDRGHIVTDEGDVHAALLELVGGEPRVGLSNILDGEL